MSFAFAEHTESVCCLQACLSADEVSELQERAAAAALSDKSRAKVKSTGKMRRKKKLGSGKKVSLIEHCLLFQRLTLALNVKPPGLGSERD